MRLTGERLAALREQERRATDAPWLHECIGLPGSDFRVVEGEYHRTVAHAGEEDAALIAAMRNALPALLGAAERLADVETGRQREGLKDDMYCPECGYCQGCLYHEYEGHAEGCELIDEISRQRIGLAAAEKENARLKYDAAAYPEMWKAEHDARREAEQERDQLRAALLVAQRFSRRAVDGPMALCRQCGKSSRLAAVGSACLACCMSADDDRRARQHHSNAMLLMRRFMSGVVAAVGGGGSQ